MSVSIYQDKHGILVKTENNGQHYSVQHGNESTNIKFQKGDPVIIGLNGITNESLIAIILHRTKILNVTFPCDENVEAIKHLQKAIDYFELRTKNRILRNVEGKPFT